MFVKKKKQPKNRAEIENYVVPRGNKPRLRTKNVSWKMRKISVFSIDSCDKKCFVLT